ncbi:hypothetical protein KAX02_00440 [candidate division WOR-3 bacterium]|nr:hypothetical protein [candidate division WOR-3 bacterium]
MKVEIKLTNFGGAGLYELVTKENDITDDVILKLGKGQPFYYAKLEAERLAVALNCDLYENGKLIRKTIGKGEEK